MSALHNSSIRHSGFIASGIHTLRCPPLAGVGGGRVIADVRFSEVTGRDFFVHLRHCVTPPPAEDTGAGRT